MKHKGFMDKNLIEYLEATGPWDDERHAAKNLVTVFGMNEAYALEIANEATNYIYPENTR